MRTAATSSNPLPVITRVNECFIAQLGQDDPFDLYAVGVGAKLLTNLAEHAHVLLGNTETVPRKFPQRNVGHGLRVGPVPKQFDGTTGRVTSTYVF